MMGIGVMMTGNNRQRKNYCFKALKFKGRCGTLYLHSTIPCLLLFDLSSLTFLAQTGQYFDMAEPGTYSMPHTVQCLAGNAVHRFVGVICNSSTKPMNFDFVKIS